MPTSKRAVRFFKDPASALTHMAGFAAAVVGLVLLLVLRSGGTAQTVGIAIYGGSLASLFLCSSLYHFLDLGKRGNRWLKRLDHAAIFLLIAGSYVPVLIHLLDGAWRITMLAVVGGIAMAGVVLKLSWIGSPRWLGLSLYLGLGWVVVIPGYLIFPQLSAEQVSWLVGGGLAYTAGAVIYALRRPNPWKHFGFHEIWHLFVLAGAAGHFFFVVTLLGQTPPPF